MPLFSIIVPVYNTEKYINQCISSILEQSYSDFELILVDDGSTDQCPAICDHFSEHDKRVRVIHKENGGLVSARQVGSRVAIGDYIVCVDSDDWIEKEYLKLFSKVIISKKPDLICCGYFVDKKDKSYPKPFTNGCGFYSKKKIETDIFPILIERADGAYFRASVWAKAFNRQIYQKQQQLVDQRITIGEDHACTKPSVYDSESVYIIQECLYHYRQDVASMTKNKKAYRWEGPQLVGKHFESQIDMSQFDFQEQVYRNVVHNLFLVAVSQFSQYEPYRQTIAKISRNLDKEYYKNAITKCHFHGTWKGIFAHAALKRRWFLLMYLYSKIRIS